MKKVSQVRQKVKKLNKTMEKEIKKIIEAVTHDVFGHESWIIIGNEQHKSFWYALIGDCGNTCELQEIGYPKEFIHHRELKEEGNIFIIDPFIFIKAKTFEELLEKIVKKIEEYEEK